MRFHFLLNSFIIIKKRRSISVIRHSFLNFRKHFFNFRITNIYYFVFKNLTQNLKKE